MSRLLRATALALFTLGLAACARGPARTEVQAVRPIYDVKSVQVFVPRSLRVSELNVMVPLADIVWNGDPPGDRYAQVARIFSTAAAEATSRRNSDAAAAERDAVVRIDVRRFHALSALARETTGGVNSIAYDLSIMDPVTGRPVAAPLRIDTRLPAFRGPRARAAALIGNDEKSRIIAHLANQLRGLLSTAAPPVRQAPLPGAAPAP